MKRRIWLGTAIGVLAGTLAVAQTATEGTGTGSSGSDSVGTSGGEGAGSEADREKRGVGSTTRGVGAPETPSGWEGRESEGVPAPDDGDIDDGENGEYEPDRPLR